MTAYRTATVVQGLRTPRALEITVAASTDVPDLSIVTDAALLVYRRSGIVQTWTATIASQSADTLVLTHPWQAGDNDIAGEQLRIYAQLTIPGATNQVECEPVTITVTAR